jgi:hypothetical protein
MSEFFNPFEFNFDPAPASTDWTSNLSFGNPGLPTGVKAGSNTPGSNGGNPINPFTPPTGQTQGPSLFDTSVANSGYNPTQYASQAGVNSVLNFLGPTASAGMTRNEGPNAGPPQSIVNWGGQNHNTGLVQNLINQFGPELAMQMMRDQSNFHAAGPAVNGIGPGNSWTLRNDPSSAAYDAKAPTGVPIVPRVPGAQPPPATSSPATVAQPPSLFTPPPPPTPTTPTPPAAIPTTPTQSTPAATQQQMGFGLPEFLTLMMLLMGSGGGALGRQQSAAPSAAPLPNNRNPLWYSPYY